MLYIICMPKVRDNKKRGDRPKRPQGSTQAARNYLRLHLGWLRGFPLFLKGNIVHWQTLPSLGWFKTARDPALSTAKSIRKAVYARNAARRKFPHALEKTVSDVEQWTRHTDQRFELLKQAVQLNHPLPDLEALMATRRVRPSTRERCRELIRQHAQIPRLLEALIWLYWRDRASFLQMLKQIEKHGAFINALLARLDPTKGLLAGH